MGDATSITVKIPAELLAPTDYDELLAQAWDEGHRIGLMQADYEYGHRLTMPNLTNPYRNGGDPRDGEIKEAER